MKKRENLIGQQFNRLTVIALDEEKTKNKKKTYWFCQCLCGNIKSIAASSLKSGASKSCGCLRNEKMREACMLDLTNKKFGSLTCISFSHTEEGRSYWKCKCDCGNEKIIRGNVLISGRTRSCGCKTKEFMAISKFIDETGNVYGYLTVIGSEFDDKDGKLKCKCLCKCGNVILVPGTYLRSSNTLSCGCKNPNTSFATMEIEKFLQENNLLYQKEYTFKDLTSEKGNHLRYDFAILNKKKDVIKLLEYDGPQHFQSTEFYGGKEYLMQLQKHDRMKDEYAKNNGIVLFRINYTQNLQKKLLEFLKL